MAEVTQNNNNLRNAAVHIAKETVSKEATKEVATATATAAASGGPLTLVAAVKNLLKLLAQKAKEEDGNIWDTEEPSKSSGAILIILILFFLLIIPTVILLVPAAVMYYPNMLLRDAKQFIEDGAETVYTSFTDKGKFFKNVLGVEHYNLETNDIVNESRQIDEQNIEIFKAIIDEAIYQSFDTYAKQYIVLPSYMESWGKTLDSIEGVFNVKFDTEGALENYRSNPYPYTLMHSPYSYYTIGDFLDGNIPADELNNDLNYAEIISVLCQNEKYTSEVFTYSEFYDLLTSETVSELLFEVQLSDEYEYEHVTEYIETSDTVNQTPNTEVSGETKNQSNSTDISGPVTPNTGKIDKLNSATEITVPDSSVDKIDQMPDATEGSKVVEVEYVKYFYRSQVKPYGLIELYQIAEISPTAPNANHPTMSNYELLNDNEIWLRARLPETYLGPSFQEERSENSVVYNTMVNAGVKPTGRSMAWYLENSLNLDGTIGHYITEEWRNIEYCKPSYIPIGASIILDMPQYINQGNYPYDYRGDDGKGETIKQAGCIDCSYAMCLAYYIRNTVNICSISKTYVSDNAFKSNTFLSDYGLTQKWNEAFDLSSITDYLTCGYPVILHIEGIWEYDEIINHEIDGVLKQEKVLRQYHTTTNGHFLVIIGFDDQGLYVYDPGKAANNQRVIPYDAFKYVDGKYIRPIIPSTTEYVPAYKINTFTSEDE